MPHSVQNYYFHHAMSTFSLPFVGVAEFPPPPRVDKYLLGRSHSLLQLISEITTSSTFITFYVFNYPVGAMIVKGKKYFKDSRTILNIIHKLSGISASSLVCYQEANTSLCLFRMRMLGMYSLALHSKYLSSQSYKHFDADN